MSEKQKKDEEKANVRRQPSKLDNERIRQILQDEERLQKHLQPLFHAMLRGAPGEEQQKDQKQQKTAQPQRQPTNIQEQVTAPPPTDSRHPGTTTPSATPGVPIDDYIPHDPRAIRQTDVFSQLYRLIQFQRDQYLVGAEYAQWQHNERPQQHSANSGGTTGGRGWWIPSDPNDHLPHDPTALGHEQLARVLADFIPTDTVRQATVPLLTPLAPEMLYPQLREACNGVILGQQANLNQIVKNSVIDFLKNPQNRRQIKKTTYGYIETNYNEIGEDP